MASKSLFPSDLTGADLRPTESVSPDLSATSPDPSRDRVGLYLTHRADLVDYATSLVKCRSRAEDVVQDAYLRFAPDGPTLLRPVQYLYRIVRNLAVDTLRRAAVERADPLEEQTAETLPATTTPEQEAMDRQTLHRLQQALETLPPPVRRAFQAHRLQGHSLQQIAEREGVSVATAHRMVRTAVVRLMQDLDPDPDSNPHPGPPDTTRTGQNQRSPSGFPGFGGQD